MPRVRNKFPKEIEAYCENFSNYLYEQGVKPSRIIEELEKKGVKGVTQSDITFWKQNAGIENRFRKVKPVEIKAEKKEEPHSLSDSFVILPKSNIEHIKNLCRDILSQLEALEYEQ